MSAGRLAPCPFCGHNDLGVHIDPYWRSEGYIPYAFAVCISCGAQGPMVQRGSLSEEECVANAMGAWERRVKA